MTPVWLSLRAGLRRGWRPWLALALLLGVMGGVVLTAAAGARRTDTAYPRLLRWANASDVQVLPTWSWSLFAGSVGAATDPSIPFLLLLAVAVVALLLAALSSAVPGRAAARVRPAAALRNE